MKKKMITDKCAKIIFILILIIASIIRVWFACLNHESNDNHTEVIFKIANNNILPDKESCLQCYHPKLYYSLAAVLVNLLSAQSFSFKEVSTEMINVFAGIILLLVLWLFLKKLELNNSTRLVGFSLISLNPSLIGINVQNTNDTFVILFSTLSIFFLYYFFQQHKLKDFLYLSIFVIFAILSKGSGWITFFGIVMALFIILFLNWTNKYLRNKIVILIFLLNILVFVSASFLGPYYDYWKNYGTPFIINKEKSSPPKLFEKTYPTGKTGITSIVDSYFTFRIVNLIQNPWLNRKHRVENYVPSRTSLWTQLYARANFAQYEGNPKSWKEPKDSKVNVISKSIFILALIPLIILILGIYIVIKNSLNKLFQKDFSYFSHNGDWIMILFFILFIILIIKFTFDYREYSSMKPIYIYPAIISFIFFFAIGMKRVEEFIKNLKIKYFLYFLFLTLNSLYMASIIAIIFRLSKHIDIND